MGRRELLRIDDMGNEAKCDLCATGAEPPKSLSIHVKCHLTAPLAVRFEGDVLILSCYLPQCSREVARFKVVRSP